MITYRILAFCLLSHTLPLFAGEWSLTLQNRETETNSVLRATSKDFFFPERNNHQWQCILKKEEITLNEQGLPALGRIIACATKDGEFIGGSVVCDNLSFEAKDGNDSHLLMPEPCIDELELRDLGGDVPNIKVVVKYEWWR